NPEWRGLCLRTEGKGQTATGGGCPPADGMVRHTGSPPAEAAPFRVGGAGCCEAPTCKRFTIRRFCCDRRRTTHQRDIRVAHARRGRSRITRARVAPCGG